MPKFAANLSMMFNEVPFLDRFAAAAAAGFKGVEYLFPYEHPAETLAETLKKNRLENVLFNLPPGDWAAGERGITCIPGREDEFRAGVAKALSYATQLGVPRLHAMAGIAPANADRAACKATLIANLRYAAGQCAAHNITLLLEAINSRDMPGFFVNTQAESYEICAAVNAPEPENATGLLPHAGDGGRHCHQAAALRFAMRSRADCRRTGAARARYRRGAV